MSAAEEWSVSSTRFDPEKPALEVIREATDAELTEPDVDRVEVAFAPSYHLEWLLGPDVEIVFLPDG